MNMDGLNPPMQSASGGDGDESVSEFGSEVGSVSERDLSLGSIDVSGVSVSEFVSGISTDSISVPVPSGSFSTSTVVSTSVSCCCGNGGGSGDCGGQCEYEWSGSAWVEVANGCTGGGSGEGPGFLCVCDTGPTGSGSFVGEVAYTPCVVQ